MNKYIIKILFLIFFIIVAIYPEGSLFLPARAQEVPEKAGSITFYLGEIKAVPINNPTRVMISKPDIADITSISKNEMLITAKAAGATGLVWWDNFGKHQLQVQVFAEDMSPIKERIDSLIKELNFPDVFTRSMDSEGKVLLLGNVKTSKDLERIDVALIAFKAKVINLVQVKEEEAMVEIDVQVLELNKDATTTLGFSWPGSLTLTESSGPTTTAQTGLKKIFHVSDFTRSAFNVTLEALVQEGKARILSQPRLACQSGKEAELLVGGEKPVMTTEVAALTVSATSVSAAGSTQVEYKEFGIKLKIKPTVKDNKIKLSLNVEVSEIGAAEILGSLTNITARAYPLTKRNVSTELFLNDGQIMAIGGLKKQKAEEDIRKTPFLGDIPILGLLFRKRTSRTGGGQGERGDSELFITLTPNIIKEEVITKEEPKPEVKEPLKEGITEAAKPTVAPKAEVPSEIKEEAKPQVPSVIEKGLSKEEIKAKAKATKEKRKKKKAAKVKAKAKASLKEEAKVPTTLKEAPAKEELKTKAKAEAPTPKEKRKKKKEAKVKVSLEQPTVIEEPQPEVLPKIEEIPVKEQLKPEAPAIKEAPKTPIPLKKVVSKEEEIKNQALQAYLAKIAQLIRDNLVYPWVARQMKMQGSLRLGMHLDYTGQLLEVRVIQPSGCALLDDDAIRTVKKIAPYPPFPPEINLKELRINLPIVYKIE